MHQYAPTSDAWKRQSPSALFQNRLLGMVFFNPSLRTRTSFEAVMLRSGGHAIVLKEREASSPGGEAMP